MGHRLAELPSVLATPSVPAIQRGPEDEGVGGNGASDARDVQHSQYEEEGYSGAGAVPGPEGPPPEPMSPDAAAGWEAVAGDVEGIFAGPVKTGWDALRTAGYGLTGQWGPAWGAAKDVGADILTKNPVAGVGATAMDTTDAILRSAGAPASQTPTSGEIASSVFDYMFGAPSNGPGPMVSDVETPGPKWEKSDY